MSNSSPVNTDKLRSHRFKARQRAWKRLCKELEPLVRAGEIRYNTVLGAGGFGLVQKWTTNQPKINGRNRTVAVKTSVQAEKETCLMALKREIFWMKKFTGCEHLVQLVDLPNKTTTLENVNNENCPGIPIIVMEEFGCGSLDLLINRLFDVRGMNLKVPDESAATRVLQYIPNRALWMIRAVIGMAYPPEDPESRKGKVIRESMNDVKPGTRPSRIIHSDIDVFNTFVGYSNKDEVQARQEADSEHVWHPIVKIADYGCMVRWDYNWNRETKKASLWGKADFKAPEQFDPDGQFGTHTNIYQVGQIMHDLITLTPVDYNHRKMMRIDTQFGRVWTYGGRLLEFPSENRRIRHNWINVDHELRELVALCMAVDPIERPTVDHLETICVSRIAKMDLVNRQVKLGQVPESPVWVAESPDDAVQRYKQRVPHGQVEPDTLLTKFYNEYFLEDWETHDKYEEYWANDTLQTPDVVMEDAPSVRVDPTPPAPKPP
ncbi:kinase-like protein [Xylaria bambusicola]|uniref:kinase-like protein n=1 Tax=Xylaria bambusicola TaxID=326684 RepID=UPI002007789F|nr:kinase-like protein [Xylaria bambusicola]KAI0513053.1 kinase-like protein [Xylaria bambusicola]